MHRLPRLRDLFAALWLCLLAACAGSPDNPNDPEGMSVRSLPQGGATVMMVGPVPRPIEERGTFNFQSRSTDIREVIRAVFANSPINVVLDPDVTGPVTLDLKNTTPAAALLELIEIQDLTVTAEAGAIRIGQRETRIFDLGYVNATDWTRTFNDQGKDSDIGGGTSHAESSSGDDNKQNLWKETEKHLKSLVGKNSQLVVNPIAGKILVTDRPDVLDLIERYLQAVEEAVRRQVVIRAEVLEVTLNKDYELGIDYAAFPDFFNMSDLGLLAGGAVLSQTGLAPTEAPINFGILKPNEFGVLISALQKQGQVRVLQSPRIATLNNQPACLAVVNQVPIIDRQVYDTTAGTRTEFDIRFRDVGVVVQVTPQIAGDGRLILQIEPRVSEVTGTVTTPDGLQVEPIIAEQKAFTTVTVQDGQPVLIGGLRSVRKKEELTGVPVLSDIPLLGALFRHTLQQTQHLETLIYLVPTVLDGEGMRRAVELGLNRIERIKEPFKLTSLDMSRAPETTTTPLARASRPDRTAPATEQFATLPRETVTELTPRGLALFLRDVGYRRFLRGDLVGARRTLRCSDAINPLRGHARMLLGVIALESGAFGEARRMTRLALDIDPRNPYALNNLGVMEVHAGRYDTAARLFHQSLKALPGSANARNNLAVALTCLGHADEARDLLESVLDWNPEHQEARRNLTRLAVDGLAAVALPMEGPAYRR